VIVHAPQMVAVRHRCESAVEGEDLKSVPGKIEVANDFGPQQRDDIRANRKLEAGKNFFRASRPAENVAALEHEHLLSCFRQIGGVGKAVVASANHDYVVLHSARKSRHNDLKRLIQIDWELPQKMTRHSIEKVSFCRYLRLIADSRSVHCGACRQSVAVHIIQRSTLYTRKSSQRKNTRGRLAHWNSISRENFRPLPEPELPRVVGILHGQRVRSASRTRVQRDSQCVRLDRYFAAV